MLPTMPRDELREVICAAADSAANNGLAEAHADKLRATADTIQRVAIGTFYYTAETCGCPAFAAGLTDADGYDAPGVNGIALSTFIRCFDSSMTRRYRAALAVEVTD